MTLLQIQFSISQILFVGMLSQITKQNSSTETAFHRTLERLDKILIKNQKQRKSCFRAAQTARVGCGQRVPMGQVDPDLLPA